ncbi:MAG: peptide chain release factor N(5)-glutamine methyltransferase [Phycisphaerae bacterium]|jgi:release factor glutamine methyltransferase|nr:peptide chain release factor N(5)-glutamine methyltransferase [Phycisphaerae bacterium]
MQQDDNSWTIGKLIDWTRKFFESRGIEEPRLEAEILLAHVLGLQRIELYTNYASTVESTQRAGFRELVRRRSEHEPSQYLTGCCEFMSLAFKVTPACLIPRPETELLVEEAVRAITQNQTPPLEQNERAEAGPAPLIADICTGCGCVAVALAVNVPQARLLAADISPDAIALAKENAEAHSVADRVEFFEGDLLAPLADYAGKIDVLVANPPYVTEEEYGALAPEIRDYEPRDALVAGPAGTEMHRRIIAEAAEYLKPGGILLMEIAANQGDDVLKSLAEAGTYTDEAILKDYSKHDRVARAVRCR